MEQLYIGFLRIDSNPCLIIILTFFLQTLYIAHSKLEVTVTLRIITLHRSLSAAVYSIISHQLSRGLILRMSV